MEGKYIPALITLVAGLVSCIICLVKGIGIIRSLVILLLVLIIFYIIGSIVRVIIVRTLREPSMDDEMEVENTEEGNTDTEKTKGINETKDMDNANKPNE